MTYAAEFVLPEGDGPHPAVVSFTCPWGPMRNEEADHAAWNDAITFLSAKMGA